MKHHLRRVMGNSILTYEEITTILCQIEQVLNNRSLMALTNNPDDIFALTPSMLVNGSRVALVRTSRGEFTRPVSKLRRLPIKNIDLHNANDECTQ